MVKKLARIIKNGELSNINKNDVPTIKNNFNLSIELDDNGKIRVIKENMWLILRILDDDYLHSEITDRNYEARSKLKK